MKVHKENKKNDTATGKGAKQERKKKTWYERGTSYVLYALSMVRLCMEGYLYVGRPVSSKEGRLVTTVAVLTRRCGFAYRVNKLGELEASMGMV